MVEQESSGGNTDDARPARVPPRRRASDPTGRPDLPSTPRHRPATPQQRRAPAYPARPGPGPASPRGGGAPAGRREPVRERTPGQSAPPRPSLSAREVEVLLCWFQSDSKSEVSTKLGLAPGTISTYLSRIRVKYELVGRAANSKAALVARAVQDGLITLDDL